MHVIVILLSQNVKSSIQNGMGFVYYTRLYTLNGLMLALIASIYHLKGGVPNMTSHGF